MFDPVIDMPQLDAASFNEIGEFPLKAGLGARACPPTQPTRRVQGEQYLSKQSRIRARCEPRRWFRLKPQWRFLGETERRRD